VRKNSVFGNLFKKKTKSSKDEDVIRDEEPLELKVTAPSAPIQSEAARQTESLDNGWGSTRAAESDELRNSHRFGTNEKFESKSKHTTTDVNFSRDMVPFTRCGLQSTRLYDLKLRKSNGKLIWITMHLLSQPIAAAALPLPRFCGQTHLCIHFWTMTPAYTMCSF
jgi:hypothetical protein